MKNFIEVFLTLYNCSCLVNIRQIAAIVPVSTTAAIYLNRSDSLLPNPLYTTHSMEELKRMIEEAQA